MTADNAPLREAVDANSPQSGNHRPWPDLLNLQDESTRAFARLQAETGRRSLLPVSLGLLMVAIFAVAAALIFAAIQQGADLQQLLIAAMALLIANLLLSVTWMATRPPRA